jgi:hypothetical protein
MVSHFWEMQAMAAKFTDNGGVFCRSRKQASGANLHSLNELLQIDGHSR